LNHRGVVGIALSVANILKHVRIVRGSAMALGRETGGGSRKGIPDRTTRDIREALAAFAEANVGKLQTWLDAIAE